MGKVEKIAFDKKIMHRIYTKILLSESSNDKGAIGKASILAPMFRYKISLACGLYSTAEDVAAARKEIVEEDKEISKTKSSSILYLKLIGAQNKDIENAKENVDKQIFSLSGETDLISYFNGIRDSNFVYTLFIFAVMHRVGLKDIKIIDLDNYIVNVFLIGLENTIKKTGGYYHLNKSINKIMGKQVEWFNKLSKEAQDGILGNIKSKKVYYKDLDKKHQKNRTLVGIWNILYTPTSIPNEFLMRIIKEHAKYINTLLRGKKDKRIFKI